MVLLLPGRILPFITLISLLGLLPPHLAFAQTPSQEAHNSPAPAAELAIPGANQNQPAQTSTGQKPLSPSTSPDPPLPPPEDRRVLGVLPNYRTAELSTAYRPLNSKQKLTIAVKDSFDYPLFFVSAAYALLYQAENNHPEFGQGTKGYFHRLGTSYLDNINGNMLTEGFLPILLREDPRYFRKAEGTIRDRVLYSATRIFVTRTDAGGQSFNYAEVLGNGIAAGIGLAYYPDSRDPKSYVENWMTQLATDAVSQELKEFWPDIKRYWITRHRRNHPTP